jgi:hypothetical protein
MTGQRAGRSTTPRGADLATSTSLAPHRERRARSAEQGSPEVARPPCKLINARLGLRALSDV